jgi:hypothetical protein
VFHGHFFINQDLKSFSQLDAGSVETAPNGPHRDSQDSAYLFVTQAVEFFHHDDRSVIRRQ